MAGIWSWAVGRMGLRNRIVHIFMGRNPFEMFSVMEGCLFDSTRNRSRVIRCRNARRERRSFGRLCPGALRKMSCSHGAAHPFGTSVSEQWPPELGKVSFEASVRIYAERQELEAERLVWLMRLFRHPQSGSRR